MSDFKINECFADDSGKEGYRFWDNFANKINLNVWEENCPTIYNYKKSYDSLPDPDGNSKRLYEFHEYLWNNQREKMKSELPKIEENPNKLRLPEMKKNACELYQSGNEEFRLSSDSIMSIYWHWTGSIYPFKQSAELMKLISEDNAKLDEAIRYMENISGFENEKKYDKYKYFLWLYLQISNTIGGFIVFSRHKYSINQERGILSKINDRFDLTLECIRRYYIYLKNTSEKNDNPLFNYLDKDKDFFEMFGSFKNYVDFFCLQDWVNDKYEVLDLLGDTKTTLLNADKVWKENKVLPCDFETDEQVKRWWNLYSNLMYRLNKRNKRIEEILNSKK